MHVSESFLQLVRRVLVGFALVLLAFVVSDTLSPRQSVSAQNSGVVGIATISQPAFTSQASSASSGIFKDIGQAANNLYFCTTGFTGTINLEWSPTGSAGPFKPIVLGSYTTDTGCHSLTAAGYYPNLRSTMTRALGSLSAWYNASAGPIGFTPAAIGSNGPTSPISCDQNITASITTGSGWSQAGPGPNIAGQALVVCGMTLTFNGATSAGSVLSGFSTVSGCTSPVTTWDGLTTANTPQYLAVPLTQRVFIQSEGNWFCINNTSGATVVVSTSYASVQL